MRYLSFLILSLAVMNSYAASFDCKKASNKIESTICSNPTISDLDSQLGNYYKNSLSATDKDNLALKESQKSWMVSRNDCLSNESLINSCLEKSYQARINELKDFSEKNITEDTQVSDQQIVNSDTLLDEKNTETITTDNSLSQSKTPDLKEIPQVENVEKVTPTQDLTLLLILTLVSFGVYFPLKAILNKRKLKKVKQLFIIN